MQSTVEAASRASESIDGVGAELDAMLDMLDRAASQQQEQQGGSRPPASRKVVANLPVLEATEERLSEWGPECVCPVCTCEVVVGDRVQVLPCKHMFHPVCVSPWFRKNNSCPICRKVRTFLQARTSFALHDDFRCFNVPTFLGTPHRRPPL